DTWITTGSMNHQRSHHTATLLKNGKVLVTGGYYDISCNIFVRNDELYNPSTGTWRNTDKMSNIYHTTILLSNGKVLMAGGLPAVSSQLYDPLTGTWNKTGPMSDWRQGHSASLLKNGSVLVAGGHQNNWRLFNAELYDPSTGTWKS
ncbi:unnamed protein product, partial [Adineta ricciae]